MFTCFFVCFCFFLKNYLYQIYHTLPGTAVRRIAMKFWWCFIMRPTIADVLLGDSLAYDGGESAFKTWFRISMFSMYVIGYDYSMFTCGFICWRFRETHKGQESASRKRWLVFLEPVSACCLLLCLTTTPSLTPTLTFSPYSRAVCCSDPRVCVSHQASCSFHIAAGN